MKFLAVVSILFFAFPAMADDAGFQNWMDAFKIRAEAQGISPQIVNNAFATATFNDRVIELDQKQPESQITFDQYLKSTVTAQRVAAARKQKDIYGNELQSAQSTYGVSENILLALWAKESSFGKVQGNYNLISSLATLAYEGRRAAFFEKELIAALKIMQQQNFSTDQMTGSWAGAMGQCQFMPTTYLNYAADGDNDGIIDIWGSEPDVLASMGNYLRAEGWHANESWGRRVLLPANFDESLIGKTAIRSVDEWKKLGIKDEYGQDLPDSAIQGYLIASDPGEDMYLVYNNFDVLLRWNRSRYFALAVGELANRIGQ